MEITKQDIETIATLLEELQLYRLNDEEPREMAVNGYYEDERALAKKLGITLEEE